MVHIRKKMFEPQTDSIYITFSKGQKWRERFVVARSEEGGDGEWDSAASRNLRIHLSLAPKLYKLAGSPYGVLISP